MKTDRLGIGIIGSGFNARFHLHAFVGVRDAEMLYGLIPSSGLKLFFSREVKGKSGEDLIEKQNAEIGQMPVVANEAVPSTFLPRI